jgi:hypothetical protein
MAGGEPRRRFETWRFTRRTKREIVPELTAVLSRVEVAMDTVTIASTRGFALSDMEILVGSAIVIAALAWMVFSGLRHFRSRHTQPRV